VIPTPGRFNSGRANCFHQFQVATSRSDRFADLDVHGFNRTYLRWKDRACCLVLPQRSDRPMPRDSSETAPKRCPCCGRMCPRDQFGPSAGRRDGLQVYCRPCTRIHDKKHYDRHRARRRAALAAWTHQRRDEHRRLVYTYLVAHPCADCGEADPVVLEFDHVRGVKRADVERLVTVGCSRDALIAEFEKCVVRCTNCHRRRTAKHRSYARYRLAEEARSRPATPGQGATAADGPDTPG
jgi:hypothetical protein